jgi:hypothetical protein
LKGLDVEPPWAATLAGTIGFTLSTLGPGLPSTKAMLRVPTVWAKAFVTVARAGLVDSADDVAGPSGLEHRVIGAPQSPRRRVYQRRQRLR